MNSHIYCCRANHPTPYNLKQQYLLLLRSPQGSEDISDLGKAHSSIFGQQQVGCVSEDGGYTLLTHILGPLAMGWYSVASVVTTELTSVGSHSPAGKAGLAPWWWKVLRELA